MMDSTAPPFRALRRLAFACAALACALPALAFNHDRVAPGLAPSDYWEGKSDHYVSELLTAPQTAVQFPVAVPNDGDLFANRGGGTVNFVALVCYPTSQFNTDADYVLPGTGGHLPHM